MKYGATWSGPYVHRDLVVVLMDVIGQPSALQKQEIVQGMAAKGHTISYEALRPLPRSRGRWIKDDVATWHLGEIGKAQQATQVRQNDSQPGRLPKRHAEVITKFDRRSNPRSDEGQEEVLMFFQMSEGHILGLSPLWTITIGDTNVPSLQVSDFFQGERNTHTQELSPCTIFDPSAQLTTNNTSSFAPSAKMKWIVDVSAAVLITLAGLDLTDEDLSQVVADLSRKGIKLSVSALR
ncbi:hypothetical protein JX265_003159 [Neoarthrinium moseri]|uniref:Uncharacterized protein n=1 Tax=Neoarthrinium moseri TaxID=1658444 RepID=A0A9Q0ATU3_9PEZI|nr:hypothetical protein JX265_003159 [Neoarthrinium moseri]